MCRNTIELYCDSRHRRWANARRAAAGRASTGRWRAAQASTRQARGRIGGRGAGAQTLGSAGHAAGAWARAATELACAGTAPARAGTAPARAGTAPARAGTAQALAELVAGARQGRQGHAGRGLGMRAGQGCALGILGLFLPRFDSVLFLSQIFRHCS